MHLSYRLAEPSSAVLISTDVEENQYGACYLACGSDRRLGVAHRASRLGSAHRRGVDAASARNQPEPLPIDAPEEPAAAADPARLPQQSVERTARAVAIESVGPQSPGVSNRASAKRLQLDAALSATRSPDLARTGSS